MSRMVGTVSRGLRAPIIREGDDLKKIVTESVLEASRQEGFEVRNRDIVAMTEAIVARAQGNYATVSDIAEDVRAKLGRRDRRPYLSHSQPQSVCHLSAWHSLWSRKNCTHALIPIR